MCIFSTVDEATALTDSKDVVVIGLFKDKDSKEAKEFIKAAEEEDEKTYALSTEKKVFEKYNVEKENQIIVVRNNCKNRIILSVHWTLYTL